MDGKGNDSLLKTSKVTEWTFNNTGYMSILFGGFLLGGCLLAYIIAICRGSVDPFLPLISDAAGSPPQNGIFGTLVSIGGMIGVIFMCIQYMIVMEKNQEKSKIVTTLNKFSFFTGIVSLCSIMLITGYPVNFYRHKEVWLHDVGIPHMIGGVAFFSFAILYVAIQSIITLFQKSSSSVVFFRIFICLGCCVAYVYHIVTVPDHFGGLSKFYYSNATGQIPNDTTLLPPPSTLGASLKLPIDTSGTYVTSAITEWMLVILLCSFFFTFFKEAQEYSLLIVVETHSPQVENLHEVVQDPSSKSPLGGSGRRESEIRTLFRKDSSCQTPVDESKEPTFPKPEEKYTKRQISSFDMFSGDKLEKLIESHIKNKTNDSKTNDSKTNDSKTNDSKTNVEVKVSSNGLKDHDTLTETCNGTVANENAQTDTSNGIAEPAQLSNGVANEVSETQSGIIDGTTDRGC